MRDIIVQPRTDEPDPVIDAYKKGIDRTLVRENLKLSVEERVRGLIALHEFAAELRAAMKEAQARS